MFIYQLNKNNNFSLYHNESNISTPNISKNYILVKICIAFKLIFLIVLLILNLFISDEKYLSKNENQLQLLKVNDFHNFSYINKKGILNYYSNFSKFENMFPRTTANSNKPTLNLNEIFNSRELYISDVKITPEYIKFIRPLNETEEAEFSKIIPEKKIFIDNNMFKKRKDQYDFKAFCELALKEKLIDNNTIEYNNKPIISIIVPSFNKEDILLKTIRSIQNQNFKNIEIIIVNDCSNDNSSRIFNYLLETDPRIRIFHHLYNLGLYRSRLDGILYSRGKYLLAFDTGDFFEDNYVLTDTFNIIEKYKLDSCKFLFRTLRSFEDFNNNFIPYHVGSKTEIIYKPKQIKKFNTKIFKKSGNIWNRLVRDNIYIKSILLLNELMLNVYKNMWEDIWYNEIINKVSFNYVIFDRIGYVYYYDRKGEGTPKYKTPKQKNNLIREYIGFLYFDYNFCKNKACKVKIIKKLKDYNKTNKKVRLKDFISHFYILNDLLDTLINDNDLNEVDKKFCKQLLNESKFREKQVKN